MALPLIPIAIAVAIGFALTRKQKDADTSNGAKKGTVAIDYEDVQQSPTIQLGTGEKLVVALPGLREQWKAELTGGGGRNMDDILTREWVAERGDVYLTMTPLGTESFDVVAKILGNNEPQGTVTIAYNP